MNLVRPFVILAFAAAAACGGGNGTPRDAGFGDDDGRVDAPADAPTTPVTVTLTSAGAGVAGATVYFQNADSTLVAKAMTDGSGDASQLMNGGGFVTVISVATASPAATTTDYVVQTIAGVQPGDHLHIVNGNDPGAEITVHVTVPVSSGSASYSLSSTCGGGLLTAPTTPTDITLTGCNGAADMLVTATTVAGAGTYTRVTSYTPAQAVSDGATIVLTNPYAAEVPAVATYTNAAAFENLTFDRVFVTGNGVLGENASDLPPSGGSAMISVPFPVISGATALTTTSAQTPADENSIYETGAASNAYALDVGSAVLSQISAAPAFDQPAHSATWTEASGGVAPVFVRADISAMRASDNLAWDWSVVQARAGKTVVFPVLPTDFHDFNVGAADPVSVNQVTLATPPLGTYDSVRAFVFALTDPSQLVSAAAPGRAVVEQYFGAGLRSKIASRRLPRPPTLAIPSMMSR